MKTKRFYRRNLPHLTPAGGTFFVTSRLAGSMPLSVLEELRKSVLNEMDEINLNRHLSNEEKAKRVYMAQKRFFKRYDDYLDQALHGPDYLKTSGIAQILVQKFHQYDGILYDLIAFTILSNHFHLVIDTYLQIDRLPPRASYDNLVPYSKIMKLIKGGSAYLANRTLERKGTFWKDESYDHLVRNQLELKRIIRYVANNPVKAGLVKDWREWSFTYVREDYQWIMD